jgi:hypothetical protein
VKKSQCIGRCDEQMSIDIVIPNQNVTREEKSTQRRCDEQMSINIVIPNQNGMTEGLSTRAVK